MGFLDQAKKLINKNASKVDQGIEKAGDIIDDKTGGKYESQVDKAQQALEDKTGDH